jgi:hypothetical protein
MASADILRRVDANTTRHLTNKGVTLRRHAVNAPEDTLLETTASVHIP